MSCWRFLYMLMISTGSRYTERPHLAAVFTTGYRRWLLLRCRVHLLLARLGRKLVRPSDVKQCKKRTANYKPTPQARRLTREPFASGTTNPCGRLSGFQAPRNLFLGPYGIPEFLRSAAIATTTQRRSRLQLSDRSFLKGSGFRHSCRGCQ